MGSLDFLIGAQTAEEVQQACGDQPGLLCRKALEWTGSETTAELVDWLTRAPLRIVLIVVVAAIVNRLLRRAIRIGLRRMAEGSLRRRLAVVRELTPDALLDTKEMPDADAQLAAERSRQRVDALTTALRSGASFVVWTIAAFMILGEVGVSLGPLLAGAGVVGIAIGFGAQSLIKDILSGFFILFEDQFAVGDIVDLGEGSGIATGVVEQIALRSTRLRAVDGTVWHVPNGEILKVGNMSQNWSRALIDFEVAYATDLDKARNAIKEVADEVWHEQPGDVLEEPEVWGVEALGASGIAIRLVVKTRPSEQWRIMRILRERVKKRFDAAGIEIPFPQQTIWMRPELEPRDRGGEQSGSE
ncbi:MAG TPA: mechanosensitive ion channel family protein [Solirubrobacterales bacterium]|nr:mechanosensitive ion channel family protein [Solirubrobacterales bacterium]